MPRFTNDFFSTSFPDNLLPVVEELRRRVRRLVPKQMELGELHHLDYQFSVWWTLYQIGIANRAFKAFAPILVTVNDLIFPSSVIEWGSYEEIDEAMTVLRRSMLLDDISDV